MKSQYIKALTFASRTGRNTDQSLNKRVLFSHPRRNSIYFSPSLWWFNFFATAQQPTIADFLNRTKQVKNQQQYDVYKVAPIGNSGFKKLAVHWLQEVQLFNQILLVTASFVLRNRQLVKPAKRYRSCYGDSV